MKNLFLSLILSHIVVLSAVAEQKSLPTVAGQLTYLLNETTSQCEVRLNQKIILKLDCEGAYLPAVLGNFRGNFGGVDQLVVFQELPMGNACNGGPLHLIGLRKNQSYLIKPIDFCGGEDPVVKASDSSVTITFPSGPPNRGKGRIPTEKWEFKNAKLIRIR